MFVAHAPAGYIIGSAVSLMGKTAHSVKHKIIAFSIAGALAPDIDLIRQFFIDNNRVGHHNYITHTPVFWAACFVATLPIAFFGKKHWLPVLGFFLGAFSHLVLDTPMGGIMWLYPISSSFHSCIEIETVLDPYANFDFYGIQVKGWMINVFSHWSFSYEISIIKAAFAVWAAKACCSLFQSFGSRRRAQALSHAEG